MTAAAITVAPKSGRKETLAIGIIGLVIAAIAAVAISQRQVEETLPRLYDWQISAFYDLGKVDRAVYSSLVVAMDELWWMHEDILSYNRDIAVEDSWPTMQELGEYYFLAPFAEDLFWSQYGEVKWSRVTSFSFEGSTVYHGFEGTTDEQSAYLVVLSHAHKGASFTNGGAIWMHADANAPAPDTVVRDSLILNGWKEVVPYSGAMEVKRIRRR
ncbi:MAG: hypothetical protein COA96_00695 [SAR86 cluster bacterium]|uniref:Uncharacterized protein n=1 Tax=SAR86 cluster bacterium TaxID=2030880 RepID=A0A2A5BB19_9GAMM|nr:MAG: hypothetical protein COA96_00695 [SAR86 cluster bacterium]